MKYMLDTNICVGLIQQKPKGLIARLIAHPLGDVGLSIITVSELSHGAHKSAEPQKNLSALEQFLAPFEIADFDQSAADAYGKLRADLEKRGNVIGSMDMLIGAHALSLGIILVTNNINEFSRIPNLKLEDWMA